MCCSNYTQGCAVNMGEFVRLKKAFKIQVIFHQCKARIFKGQLLGMEISSQVTAQMWLGCTGSRGSSGHSAFRASQSHSSAYAEPSSVSHEVGVGLHLVWMKREDFFFHFVLRMWLLWLQAHCFMADNELKEKCTCTFTLKKGKWWCAYPSTLGRLCFQVSSFPTQKFYKSDVGLSAKNL